MKHVTVYTDGACSGNPGPGGWAAVLIYGGREKWLSGGFAETTNNRMELTAAVTALEALKEPCQVSLHTDSQYIANAINEGWLESWKRRGWKRKGGEVKNIDLWQKLDELLAVHSVSFIWVRGHDGDEYNEKCDKLAVQEREKFS